MKRRTIGVAAVVVILLIGGFVWVCDRRAEGRMLGCQSNLASMGQAFGTYAIDSGETFPLKAQECPAIASLILQCGNNRKKDLSLATADEWMDYIYVYWPDGTNTPGDYPVMYDRRLSNHGGKGINILKVSGTRERKGAPGTVVWDQEAAWLKQFALQHPEYTIRLPDDCR